MKRLEHPANIDLLERLALHLRVMWMRMLTDRQLSWPEAVAGVLVLSILALTVVLFIITVRKRRRRRSG